MRRTTTPTALVAALALSAALASGCGSTDGATADASSGAVDQETTPRSLVAAVEDHLDRSAKIAAPLYARDLDYRRPGRVPDGVLAVEVALDEEVGDNSHVRVVVTPDLDVWDRYPCDGSRTRYAAGCEETVLADGAEQRLTWAAATPEEDPGYLAVAVRREDRVVEVSYYGEEVPEDLHGSDLAGLADDLVSLAADPAVGFETTAAYLEAGEEIDDDVMLEWFGQGNGSQPPPGYDGEDAPESGPRAVRATVRSLAAAATEQLGEEPTAVTPLGGGLAVRLDYDPADVEGAQGVESGVEPWAFTLVVDERSRGGDPYDCPLPRGAADCELLETDLGVAHLVLQDADPEADPGVVTVLARRADSRMVLTLVGPHVDGGPDGSDLTDLVDRMAAVVLDEAVGTRTSTRLLAAGEAIPDDVWQG